MNQWTSTGPDGGAISALTLIPTQAGVALASGGNSIYRTTDSGATWTVVLTGLAGGAQRFAVDPANPSLVLVAGQGSLYSSNDAGLTFSPLAEPESAQLEALAFSADGQVLYGGSDSSAALFSSNDLGAHWTSVSNGLPASPEFNDVTDIAVDPSDHDTLYATIRGIGVYKSGNGGQNWAAAGLAGLTVLRIAIDPSNSQRLLVASFTGLWLSTDGAASWTQTATPALNYLWVGFDPSNPQNALAAAGNTQFLTSANIAAGTWTATGGAIVGYAQDVSFNAGAALVGSSVGISFSADSAATFTDSNSGIQTSSATAVVGATDGTIYSSFYGGLTGVYKDASSGWSPTNNTAFAALFQGVPDTLAIAVAPSESLTVYAEGYHGAFVTRDGGTTWNKASSQFDNVLMSQVAVDPKDPQTAYVTTVDSGLWRTSDGGNTWTLSSSGLPVGTGAIAVDPSNSNVVYAASTEVPQTLYKSTDAGASWAATGLTGQLVASIAIDPTNSSVLYAASNDVYKSTDGGSTWQALGTGAPAVYAILVDPQVTGDLVALADGTLEGALRSVDGGTTWEPLPLGPHSEPTRLLFGVLDPAKPQHILASTASTGLIELEIAPDLSVSINSLPATLAGGTTATATIHASNAGPFAASAVKLSVALPSSLTVPSPPTGCSVTGSTVQCDLGSIQTNTSVDTSLTFSVDAAAAAGTLVASIAGHESDSDMTNNTASVSVTDSGSSATTTQVPPTSGGGGGRLEWLTLAALLSCLALSVRQARGRGILRR